MTKNTRLPRASWDLGQICRRSQADVRETAFGLPALDQDRFTASAPRVRARMSRALGHSVLPLPRENRRLSMEIFCRDYFSSSSIQTVYMGLSTGVYFSGTTSFVGKTEDLFLLVVAQDPIPRTYHLSDPLKNHCVASNNRMYSHFSLIPQRSRTY